MFSSLSRLPYLIRRLPLSYIVIWALVGIVLFTQFQKRHLYTPERVIQWDVKSYYAYLPATLIHGDWHLRFMDENPDHYKKWYWPAELENGNRLIITSMGLSFLYLPFFLLAHGVALLTSFSADGYSLPYSWALMASLLFYTFAGLIWLRRFLRLHVSERTTAWVLAAIYLGTNLLYYSLSKPVTHAYNFALIALFLWLTHQWHQQPNIRRTLAAGLLYGLIVLIRPSNVLIILFFAFYQVTTWQALGGRLQLFLRRWPLILLMVAATLLVWVPQMLYWKSVTGHFIYFSYGVKQTSFFWGHPQIGQLLFSFRKGWFIYTPLMLLAVAGLSGMWKSYRGLFIPLVLVLLPFIYVQASWWSWWFGGSYGHRAFVDIYGLMAVPLATTIEQLRQKNTRRWLAAFLIVMFVASAVNVHNMRRFNKGSMHYYWMSKEAYFEHFFSYYPKGRYWRTIPRPDYRIANQGVYVSRHLIERYNGPYEITPRMLVQAIKEDLASRPNQQRFIRYAQRIGISVDSALSIHARNRYEQRWSLRPYIRPLEQQLQARHDSLYGAAIRHFSDSLSLAEKAIHTQWQFPQEQKWLLLANPRDTVKADLLYEYRMVGKWQDQILIKPKRKKPLCYMHVGMEYGKQKIPVKGCDSTFHFAVPKKAYEYGFQGNFSAVLLPRQPASLVTRVPVAPFAGLYATVWVKGDVSHLALRATNDSLGINEQSQRVIRKEGNWQLIELAVPFARLPRTASLKVGLYYTGATRAYADELKLRLVRRAATTAE